MKQFLNFISVSMTLFNLIKILGNKKNVYAPQLYKAAVTVFSNVNSMEEDKVIIY
jgi:hypothetical protein